MEFWIKQENYESKDCHSGKLKNNWVLVKGQSGKSLIRKLLIENMHNSEAINLIV
jgi:hypothetical protein